MEDEIHRVLVAHPGTQHSRQTALALQRAGLLQHYVTCFYYKTSPQMDAFLKWLPFKLGKRLERQLRRRRSDELDQDAVLTFPLPELIYVFSARLGIPGALSEKIMRWRNRWFDRHVAALVRKKRPDAVICYDSSALDTFRACKETGSLAILDQSISLLAHTIRIMDEEFQLHPGRGEVLNVPEWLVDQCLQEALLADKVLVASEFVRDGLVENGIPPERIVMLRYGVDASSFHTSSSRKEGKFRVLYVGHLSRRKGIRYLLEAFSELGLPDAELLMVGSITDAEDILESYRGMFRHVPQVPYGEMPAYFQDADIFVFPSLLEGMGLVILEAMAAGLPVITTENAACVVRDGIDGYVVPIRNVEALKEKMRLLYLDKGQRERMGRQARLHAENYTWESYQRRLGKLMHQFISEKKS